MWFYGMQLSKWQLVSRVLAGPFINKLLVKTNIGRAEFYNPVVLPGVPPAYTGLFFNLTPTMRFPYGFVVLPD